MSGEFMKYIIGIDMGGSTTKIVVCSQNQNIYATHQWKTEICIDDFLDNLKCFLLSSDILLQSVLKFVLTGMRSSFVKGNIFNIPTTKVSEFEAIGCGGLYLSKLEKALVISIGTGTALVMADYEQRTHIGGSGLGGGTLCGLGKLLLGATDIWEISNLATQGKSEKIDLLVRDICCDQIASLPLCLTASNFGKVSPLCSKSDIALGLFNMVYHNIGKIAVFSTQNTPIKNIVLTGSLATTRQAHEIFPLMGELFGLAFIIPEQATFATALGSIVYPIQKN